MSVNDAGASQTSPVAGSALGSHKTSRPDMTSVLSLNADNFAELLLDDRPLIDLRAPIEYAAGSMPASVSLPLLNDEERQQVGLCYKQFGQQAAIELGQQLVGGSTRDTRIAAWRAFAHAHPNALLYCWRGGLRSQTVQAWLAATGVTLPRIAGGYKALRQCAIDALAIAAASCARPFVLGGRTGSGKTMLLNEFAAGIDLEGLARHRGSSFGQRPSGQPSQVDFEHALLRALLQQRQHAPRGILFEDESRTIGRVAIPLALHERLKQSPLVVLEVALAERATHITQEYVHRALQELQELQDSDSTGELPSSAALDALQTQLTAALTRIERRLGGDRKRAIAARMQAAFEAHRSGDTSGHTHWVQALLTHYYDPMYDYQLSRNATRIVFRGDHAAVRTWLAEQLNN